MITFVNKGKINEYYGLSTDKKPNDVPNASIFYEMNTGKLYLFDEDNGLWREQ